VPIAMSSTQMAGDGPAYYPMARAIAGGLAFSTLVSLLFLPTIYAILDDLREFVFLRMRDASSWRGPPPKEALRNTREFIRRPRFRRGARGAPPPSAALSDD